MGEFTFGGGREVWARGTGGEGAAAKARLETVPSAEARGDFHGLLRRRPHPEGGWPPSPRAGCQWGPQSRVPFLLARAEFRRQVTGIGGGGGLSDSL